MEISHQVTISHGIREEKQGGKGQGKGQTREKGGETEKETGQGNGREGVGDNE